MHGYSPYEARRLGDQADTLAELLHAGTAYPAGSRVLEVGCGVGAQTVHLVARSPDARLVAVDVSAESLAQARRQSGGPRPGAGWSGATPTCSTSVPRRRVRPPLRLLRAGAPAGPGQALAALRRLLRPGGTITVIEGDHGSAFFHPGSADAQAAIDCQVRLQAAAGGDALIGRRLHPLLPRPDIDDVVVRPRTVYADASRPGWSTASPATPSSPWSNPSGTTAGRRADHRGRLGSGDRRPAPDRANGGTFHYTFFKALAVNPPLP